MDGNTEDYTVNQNHGVNNGVTWANGKIGQAGSFNGIDRSVTISNISNPTTFSISAWIYRTEANREQHIAEFQSTQFYVSSSNKLGTSIWSNIAGITTMNINTWYHVCLVRTLSTITLYLNGIQESQTTTIGGNPGNNFYIGRFHDTGNYFFNGQINDVRIYDHALSQKEINDLSKAKILHYTFNKDEDVVYDGSGYKRNGIPGGNFLTSYDSNIGTLSGRFVSANSFIQTIDDLKFLRKNFSISAWVKSDNIALYQHIFSKGDNVISTAIYQSKMYCKFRINGTTFNPQGVTVLETNKWYHLVWQYDGEKIRFYINGILDLETNAFGEITEATDTVWIGRETNGSYFQGNISNIEVFSKNLSHNEIQDLYQTRIKIDNQGNLYADEIVEDYEVFPGLTLRELFEDNNQLVDGDFQNASLNNMVGYQGTTTLEVDNTGNYYIKTSNSTYTGEIITYTPNYKGSSVPVVSGHKYFLCNRYHTSKDGYINFGLYGAGSGFLITQATDVQANKWGYHGGIIDMTGSHTSIYLDYKFFASGITVSDFVLYDEMILLDVTDIFGAGTEPDNTELNAWYRDYITSRPKSNGIIQTREFDEFTVVSEPMKIKKDKIHIQGNLYED